VTGELRTLLPPFGKAIGGGPLAGLPNRQALGMGMDDFALYTALRETRRAGGGAAANYLVSWPWNPSIIDASLAPPMVNQRLMLVPQLVPPGQAIDGVGFIQQVAGAYTANNTNGVAAYTFDFASNTWTRVAQGTNANLWKSGVGFNVQAFGVQLAAAATWRLVWAAGLWNQSAVVTTPVLGGMSVAGGGIGANSPGLGPLSFQVDLAGSANFPASFVGGVTAGDTNHYWLAFYRNYT